MNVLVTGGAGYVGSHTVLTLLRKGHNVIVYDNLSTGHRWIVENIKKMLVDLDNTDIICELEEGDIKDKSRLMNVIDKYVKMGIHFDGVIHFAASSLVGESNEDPEKYYDNNVVASKYLFDALREKNIRNIVFSSSCAVYGIPVNVPINEEEKKSPISTYGWTKLMIERIMQDYSSAYGMNGIALRYFNAAGAMPEFNIGEVHSKETHVIPLLLKAALENKRSFSIFGTDYETADGSCVRDYIHVRDLAKAHIKALENLKKCENQGVDSYFEAYNLGTGKGASVLELIAETENITKSKINILKAEKREGDPPVLIADRSKAELELGWKPEVTQVRQSIKDAYEWELILRDKH